MGRSLATGILGLNFIFKTGRIKDSGNMPIRQARFSLWNVSLLKLIK
nr:hypothetical protein [uncultured Draconibacterium sp.]